MSAPRRRDAVCAFCFSQQKRQDELEIPTPPSLSGELVVAGHAARVSDWSSDDGVVLYCGAGRWSFPDTGYDSSSGVIGLFLWSEKVLVRGERLQHRESTCSVELRCSQQDE